MTDVRQTTSGDPQTEDPLNAFMRREYAPKDQAARLREFLEGL